MLTALEWLKLECDLPYVNVSGIIKLWVVRPPTREKLGNQLTFELPNLVSLEWHRVQPMQEELVLSCPKLELVVFEDINSMRIMVKDAALVNLKLANCEEIQSALVSPQDLLGKTRSLSVHKCSEVERCLIQDIGHMRNLERLYYRGFPAACMPTSFPESLQEIHLCPDDWSQGLPRGLKGLHNMKKFTFYNECKFWDNMTLCNIKKPFRELLPTASLNELQLGMNVYERQPDGALQLSDHSMLHDTPHGQYLAGLRPQPAPNA